MMPLPGYDMGTYTIHRFDPLSTLTIVHFIRPICNMGVFFTTDIDKIIRQIRRRRAGHESNGS